MRETRQRQGLTLEQLSQRSGISRSMLSAVERDKVNPTFSVVWNITQALGIDLQSFGRTDQAAPLIEHQHAYSTPVKKSADELCSLYLLSPKQTLLPAEWYDVRLEKHGELDSTAHAVGTYEHLTCLKGSLSVTVAGHTVLAKAGDTLRYQADRAHSIRNMANAQSRALLLVALPQQYTGKR